ncbi:hypothetical protein cand_027270 [Cryptosporidium andersoni]|uniref:Uncharacterized protein n=1 Tax=Cryptosporidium andersoni TaxID=117008 RepID=A0A1J4MR34_9CRYT|nr:hypothetical protein cand_027270 [Cryptosporidium andersoni]
MIQGLSRNSGNNEVNLSNTLCSEIPNQYKKFAFYFTELAREYLEVIYSKDFLLDYVCHELIKSKLDMDLFQEGIIGKFNSDRDKAYVGALIYLSSTVSTLETNNVIPTNKNLLKRDISYFGVCRKCNIYDFYLVLHMLKSVEDDKDIIKVLTLDNLCKLFSKSHGFSNRVGTIRNALRASQLFDNNSFNNVCSRVENGLKSGMEVLLKVYPQAYLSSIGKDYLTNYSHIKEEGLPLGMILDITGDKPDRITSIRRDIGSKFPIPGVPGPPIGPTGKLSHFSMSPSISGLTRTKIVNLTSQDTIGRPWDLPDKFKGRRFEKSLKELYGSRGYESQFLYESGKKPPVKIIYYEKPSEREYRYQQFIKKLKEENKKQREEKKGKLLKSSGYKDLKLTFDDIEEDILETEPSPIPTPEEEKEKESLVFDKKFHAPANKLKSNIYNFNRKYSRNLIGKDYFKPRIPFEEDSSINIEEATIGLPDEEYSEKSPQTSSEGIKFDESLIKEVITSKESSTPLTIEKATKDINLKCSELTRSQRKRALGLFNLLMFLNGGNSLGWFITPFCRAVYFAESGVISGSKVKLDIKKVASSCFSVLQSTKFILGDPILEKTAQQVCFVYYKKKVSTIIQEYSTGITLSQGSSSDTPTSKLD